MLHEEAIAELTSIYTETETMDMFSERNARRLLMLVSDAAVASSFIKTMDGAIMHKNLQLIKLHKIPEYLRMKKRDEANAYHNLFAQVREALLFLNS